MPLRLGHRGHAVDRRHRPAGLRVGAHLVDGRREVGEEALDDAGLGVAQRHAQVDRRAGPAAR